MSLRECAGCSAAYAADLSACPHCGSTDVRSGGSRLPQIRVACRTEGCRARGRVATVRLPSAGVNLAALPAIVCTLCGSTVATVEPFTPEEAPVPKTTRLGGVTSASPPEPGTEPAGPAPAEPEPEGGEQSSPGTSSETSPASTPTKSEPSKPAPRKRARTTGSRSGRARTGSSTARGTGGAPTDPSSETT